MQVMTGRGPRAGAFATLQVRRIVEYSHGRYKYMSQHRLKYLEDVQVERLWMQGQALAVLGPNHYSQWSPWMSSELESLAMIDRLRCASCSAALSDDLGMNMTVDCFENPKAQKCNIGLVEQMPNS